MKKAISVVITSTQNSKIKELILLSQKSSERKKQSLFVVEGRRELQHCIQAGYKVQSIFYCRELLDTIGNTTGSILFSIDDINSENAYEVNLKVYEKIAYRNSSEGVIAIVKSKFLTLSDLKLPSNPLIVVLESIEKPGNLGAILRSADAAKVDCVIVCDALTDLYNPNTIRSSIGSIFTVPVVVCSSLDGINYLNKNNIDIVTAQLQDAQLYYDVDMKKPTAIVMGTESTGLSKVWRKSAKKHIKIPMLGQLDSLNVSISTAILLFEAVRQRNLH